MDIISTAMAAEGAAPQQGGDMSMIIVLSICMIAVYFFVMRPNAKKRKQMQKLLDGLAVGDEVLTNGGIAGRIAKLPDNKDYVLIAVASGIVMQMKRNYVVAVLPKGTLVSESDKNVKTQGKGNKGGAHAKNEAKLEHKAEAEVKAEPKAETKTEDAAKAPDAKL